MERSPAPIRVAATDYPTDEADSGVYELSDQTVLLLCTPGDDLWSIAEALQSEGFSVLPVADPGRLEAMQFLPRYGIVEGSVPGAIEFLQKVVQPGSAMHAIGVLNAGEREGPLLAAGASLTLQRPLEVADVLLALQRLRTQQELMSQSREVFEHNRVSAPTPVLEGVLATIGHEIRNPLAAALANVECLRESEGLAPLSDEEWRATIDDTVFSLRRIQHVITSVSGLVRGAPPTLEKVDFCEIAAHVVDSFNHHSTRVRLAGECDVLGWASSSLLEQVMVNLVQNAVDATCGVPNADVLVRVYRAGGEARISVRDNGPGVPTALRERIFEPFFTTKGTSGTGLGLVLVRHAVARMGGVLALGLSETGSVFRVRLRGA
jgi:signal transduction histidine kinase